MTKKELIKELEEMPDDEEVLVSVLHTDDSIDALPDLVSIDYVESEFINITLKKDSYFYRK